MNHYTLKTIKNMIQNVLLEGKIEDLSVRYPNLNVKSIATKDPSQTKKYLAWMLKQIELGASLKELESAISEYDQKIARAQTKDINAFQSLKKLQQELEQINSTKSSKKLRDTAKSGSVKLKENENMVFLHIVDRAAAMLYGSGTKWCISMTRGADFETKSAQNELFYFRLDKHQRMDNYNKICIQIFRDVRTNVPNGTFVIWDAIDNDVNIDEVREHIPDIDELLKLAMKDASKRQMTEFAKLANSELIKQT